MKSIKLKQGSFFILLLLLGLTSCQPAKTYSPLFGEIFLDQSGTFRGIDPGQPLDDARKKEPQKPYSDDAYGLVYKLNVGQGKTCFVEYMSKEGKPRLVNAIVTNVILGDEGETSNLYSEMEFFLRERHGVPQGSLGDYRWEDQERNLNVMLRLLDDKKGLSLNFVPLSGF